VRLYDRPVPVEISIVVPVFNEAENVLPLAREVGAAMQSAHRSFELLFVDDASTDSTWQKIAEARQADPRVRGLRHARNAGQSAALWTGIQAATSPILATLDGDLQNDPADLPRLLVELERVDFVSGMRLQRQDTWLRKISSRIARWARRTALKVDFRDTGCAIRVFKRSVLEGVFPFNGLHRFLPVIVHGGGAKTLEVPVNHRPRVAGISKYGVWNRLGRGIYDLFAIAWYQKRRLRPVEFSELAEPKPSTRRTIPIEEAPPGVDLRRR
jgi:dolichol-phosphate mannosyltransferase